MKPNPMSPSSSNNSPSTGTFQRRLQQDQATLEGFLKEILAPLKTPPQLLDALHYGALSGGKRLRPSLALETARLLGKDSDLALPIAAALEFVHCYSLIHDDLPSMDDARLRRGLPTVHCKFDEATALLAGNSLFTLAIEVLARAPFQPDIQVAFIKRLAIASGGEGMMAGQHLDLLGEEVSFSLQEITHMQSLKTGALIKASLLMPCDAFGAKEGQKQALSLYGQCLGLAFQIKDDLLDQANTPHLTGKDGGHDAKKSTFVSLLGVDGAHHECTRLIDKAIESLDIFEEDTSFFKDTARFVMDRTG